MRVCCYTVRTRPKGVERRVAYRVYHEFLIRISRIRSSYAPRFHTYLLFLQNVSTGHRYCAKSYKYLSLE